ncbi:alpha/beta fold hydrolase [Actinopolymorpha alba]|uniref:alpha/beta fold hydrolase n=1 Tax=Actinopolymorpha alba TaxID=533267 RepID=UPI00036076B1|nr:alpha/beta hydrolase [Actinopolymorpha alba]
MRDTEGVGPAVILTHGLGMAQGSWDRLAPLLAPHWRVITYDQRGHGRSSTSDDLTLDALVGDLVAVMEARGVQRPTLIGHSMGAVVAVAAATQRECNAVVAVDGGLVVERPHVSKDRNLFEAEQRRLSVRILGGVTRLLGVGTRLSTDQLWHLVEAVESWERAVDPLYDQLPCGVLQVLAGKADPVLWGAELADAVAVAADRFHRMHPGVKQIWVDSGHAIQLERPKELADHLNEFLTANQPR